MELLVVVWAFRAIVSARFTGSIVAPRPRQPLARASCYFPNNSAFFGSFFQPNVLENSAGVSVRWEPFSSMAT